MKISNGGGAVGLELDKMSHGLKKGPWTAAEDGILMEYVKKHGEGNWNAVQKNSVLMRCGKSCRLRWANHLRPNLKKGSFTPEEERIIIQLHAKLGNKWARMAAQLPGRTDNEIKNYWNTRMKRRQRAGLPIYPQKARDNNIDDTTTGVPAFVLQEQIRQHQVRNQPPLISSNFLTSSNSQGINDISSFPQLSAGQNQAIAIPSLYNSNLYTSCSSNNSSSGFAFSLSPASSPFVSSSSNLYNQFPAPSIFQLNSGSTFEETLSFSSLLMGAQNEPINSRVQGQTSSTPPQPATSGNTISGSVSVVVANSSGKTSNYCEVPAAKGSSGLLDALLVESISLSRSYDINKYQIDNGKGIVDAANVHVEEENKYNNIVDEKQYYCDDISSSHQLSMGVKPSDSIEDDDLLSLLNNFPLSMPLPEWYTNTTLMSASGGGNGNGNITDVRNMVVDAPKNVSQGPATGNLDRALGSCSWKNMPGIC